ncbi:unnamed protein product [Parnassius apollo]|uniref:(apollo) hypothetical protein n=1 Tax=Parnassius apollo TaxID=110799 RepID=A0A8S3WPH5_PARAO|nr:unnamed protein product [Parnassius apollo]
MASKRKFSPLWNHFDSTEPKKAKCNYCSKILTLSCSSIGTLSRHMKKVHPTVNIAPKRLESIDESEENSNKNVQVATTSSTISVVTTTTSSGTRPTVTTTNIISATKGKVAGTTVKDYIVVKKPLPLIRTQQLDEQLIKMIAKGYHAFRLVEEKEFQKFVDMLNPSYKLPTRKTLSESLLSKLYNRTIESMKKEIGGESATAVCITTDGWRSVTNDDYIGITVHFIDPETHILRTVMIDCLQFNESHTMINISEFLKEKFREWCIDQKICAIVSDNASNILGAVRIGGWRSIRCFAHTINLVVKDSLEIIADTVIKVKNVVEFFNRSMPAQRKLKEIQEQMHLAPLKLKQDVCTRWNSTYDMLNRFLKIKEALIASIAIMTAELALTPNDWMIIEKSLPILSIFYEVTNEVSAENYVSASKYIVLCKLMYTQIQKFSNETVETIKGLVSFFKTELMHRFGDIEKNMLLREATILDPRFKKSGFRDIRNFEAAAADLKLKIGRIVLSDERPLQPAEPVEPTPGCSKVSSLWEQFDGEVARQVPENPVAAAELEVRLGPSAAVSAF